MENLNKRSSLLSFIKNRRTNSLKSNFVECENCKEEIKEEKFKDNLNVCPKCGFHNYISPKERLKSIFDREYRVLNSKNKNLNPIDFEGYKEKLEENSKKTDFKEAIVWARGRIGKKDAVVCVMDKRFLMGSMGSYVGEEITKAFEYATKKKLPIIIFSASGGARMQEGIISLMQMAKTANSVREHSKRGLLFINVFTHPTTGGVSASFSSLSDISISEPKALIGFAGPRVIKQTINQDLPIGFQRAEFNQEHGFIDLIVERRDLKNTLTNILNLH